MDLEAAAAQLDEHRKQWVADGLSASPVLRGHQESADPDDPEEREPSDKDSVAVEVSGPGWGVTLMLELEANGRVHVGFMSETDSVWERRRVRTPGEWGALLERAVGRASRMRLQHGQLVARTCTTGWLDWIHGNLWVMPNCLLRTRSGLLDTVANSYVSGTSARKSGHSVAYDPAAVLAAHRTNKIIPFDRIATARLHRGLTTSGLTVLMTDGTRHKLLWRSSDPAHRLLKDRLLPILGPRLTT
ncbi:hypothetical protein [Streptomyces sp. CA-111067]|jgi:hypothetical protein|uniref:hypothetical protein n=1 Tax=Streptomyces sp. CA-111067 TaxID=3240046 RepID=UPI003D977634